jgi:hypothetical protein
VAAIHKRGQCRVEILILRINPNPHCFIAITKATACG